MSNRQQRKRYKRVKLQLRIDDWYEVFLKISGTRLDDIARVGTAHLSFKDLMIGRKVPGVPGGIVW